MAVELEKIENPQELEVWVNGPDGANRLLIYRGIAVFHFSGTGGDWHVDNLHFQVGRTFSSDQIKKMTGTAYLSSIRNDGHAINAGWAINHLLAKKTRDDGRIDVQVNLSVRDSDGHLLRVGYEVQVFAKL